MASQACKSWRDGSKRFIPRSRGRVGHSRQFGTHMSRAAMAAEARTAERAARQGGKDAIAAGLADWEDEEAVPHD